MWRLFRQNNSFKQGVQIYNALVCSVASIDLMMHPEKFCELGPDILIHFWTFICLSEKLSPSNAFFASSANFMRIGAIYSDICSGSSSVSTALNAVDIINHLVNAGTLILTSESEPTQSPIKANYN